MESHVIYKYHDQLGLDLRIDKTLEIIQRGYWFLNMRQKIEGYISNCLKCISFSPTVGKTEGYLQNIPKGNIYRIFYAVCYVPY